MASNQKKERRGKKDRKEELRDAISIQNDHMIGLRFSKDDVVKDFNQSTLSKNSSQAMIAATNSSHLFDSNPEKTLRGMSYASIPSVIKNQKRLNNAALRTSLDRMESQKMKYKTRTSARCTYKKKAESTFVAVCTSHTDMIYF